MYNSILHSHYTNKTLFGDMMQDEKAMEVIDRISPMLLHFLMSGDEDFKHESLHTLHDMDFLGFSPEIIDQLTAELTKIKGEDIV